MIIYEPEGVIGLESLDTIEVWTDMAGRGGRPGPGQSTTDHYFEFFSAFLLLGVRGHTIG